MSLATEVYVKLFSIALVIIGLASSNARAASKIVEFGYSLGDGANLLFGIGDFVVGAAYNSASASLTDSVAGTVSATLTLTNFKFGYYSNGLGTHSWYGTGLIGQTNIKGEKVGGVGGNASGSTSASILGASFGYHWFWGVFDMKLGLGVMTFSGWKDLDVKDASGTSLATVKMSELPTSLPMLDFGIGFNF